MTIKDWKQFTPFYFYMAAAICLGAAAAMSEKRSLLSVLLLLTSGFLSWGLVEYVLHRFIFHYDARSERSRRFVYAAHLSHHENPRSLERLFASLRLSVPIALIYYLLAWALLGSWQATAYLFTGLIAGYFSYELLHFQAHHRAPRLRLFRYLKKYHLLHHHQTSDQRFGVTSPFVDYLFGTFQPMSKHSTRAKEQA